jgi:hypothetical protein
VAVQLPLDPISGGSANAYDYANQDSLNRQDVTGTSGNWTRCANTGVKWGNWNDVYSKWMANFWKRNIINGLYYAGQALMGVANRIKTNGMWTRCGVRYEYF